MDLPETLPARLYLLAYDPAKGRLTGRSRLGHVLRAAALVDLWLRGHLQEADGRPQANARAPLPTDPVLAAVLDDIAESKPRPWRHWIRRHGEATGAAVTEQLAAGRWIEVQPHRLLGVLPSSKVTVRDPHVLAGLGDRVRAALRGTTAVTGVDPLDAALVALAAAGELSTVLPKAQRREHEQRIAALSEVAGPAVPALRQLGASAPGG